MNCILHRRGRAKWEFHGHLARFPLHLWHLWHQWWRFYEIYDTFISEGWHMTYMTSQAWIEHIIGNSWELDKAKRLLLKFGIRGKVKREATWHIISNHTNSSWIWFMDYLGKLRRLSIFIKYRNKPRELILIICEKCYCEERELVGD